MPRVTGIQAQKKSGRVNVHVDGEFWGGISERTLAKYGLYAEKEVEVGVLDKIFREELFYRMYDRCVGKLSRRPYSVWEIQTYIGEVFWKKRRDWFGKTSYADDFDEIVGEVTKRVVLKLTENSLLSDESFAKWWVDSRVRSGPRGWRLIERELVSKKVDKEIIQGLKVGADTEEVMAEEIYKKITRSKSLPKEKIISRLQSRGFSWGTIEGILKRHEVV